MPLSKTKVDRAGRLLRDWWIASSDEGFADADLREAAVVLAEYRVGFQNPLNKVTVGVRQFVDRESDDIVVGQRLKRQPAILNKLNRFHSMRLTQMEDVGGCRAILLGGRKEVKGVLRRIRRNWKLLSLDDYVAEPKDTGYRGMHAVVERDGYPIEIQLRTPGEHDWAEAVETAASRSGWPLKDGAGPDVVLSFFELAGWAIAQSAEGAPIDKGFLPVFEKIRARAWIAIRAAEASRQPGGQAPKPSG